MQGRHIGFIVLCFMLGGVSSAYGQPQPGDIVIIGIHSDGTDRFAWTPLVPLDAGQEIFFTDAGWNATQNMFQRQVNAIADSTAVAPSGGALRYTVPAGGLAAGTVVEVAIDNRTAGTPGAYALTVTGARAADFSAANDEDVVGDQGVSISTSGDQLIVFTGSPLHPVFIFGVNTGANRWDLGSDTAQHSSDVPAGLIDGETAVAVGAGPDAGDEVDNARYAGPTQGTRAQILAGVADRNNWETSDDEIEDITGGTDAFIVYAGAGPEITVAPSLIDFGAVVLGGSADAAVTLGNIGDTDLEISVGLAGGHSGFSLPDAPGRPIPPGADSTVTVRFAPVQSGATRDTLIITHNAGNHPATVPLLGTGSAPGDSVVTVALDTAFVAPGEEAMLHISLINETGLLVGGLQFNLYLGHAVHAAIGDLEDMAPEGFEIKTGRSEDGDTLKVVVFSTAGAAIPTGAHVLGGLPFTAAESPVPDILGSAEAIDLIGVSLLVSDAFGNGIDGAGADGEVRIGIRSDVNTDGGIDIRDMVVFVAQLLGKENAALPDIGSAAFNIADGNEDGALNVGDAIVIINRILGLPVGAPKAIAHHGAAALYPGEAIIMDDGQQAVPVFLESPIRIAGAQMTFRFDPAVLAVGAPRLATETSDLVLDSHTTDGILRVVAYGLSAERNLAGGNAPVIRIPVAPTGAGDATLTLSEVLLVDRQARSVPVTPGRMRTTVAPRADRPAAFALTGNAPNPFNPGTTIVYEVPQPAHITLTVYNLLGQEVVRLADQIQAPGRYRVFWHGRNAQGQAVSSGVYVYRMTTSTGFSETRRMTLMK